MSETVIVPVAKLDDFIYIYIFMFDKFLFLYVEIEKGSLPSSPSNLSAKQQNFIKAGVVIMILALISSATTFLIRIICNHYRSVFLETPISEENERRLIEIGNVGPQRPNSEENEFKPIEIRNVGLERPTYEPRSTGGAPLNYELIICSCNNTFSLCTLPH